MNKIFLVYKPGDAGQKIYCIDCFSVTPPLGAQEGEIHIGNTIRKDDGYEYLSIPRIWEGSEPHAEHDDLIIELLEDPGNPPIDPVTNEQRADGRIVMPFNGGTLGEEISIKLLTPENLNP